MADKKRDDQRPDEGQDAKEGHSVLVGDQSSFVDEGSRVGKQFGNGGRKVADLEHVGASSPDADGDTSEPPAKRR